MKFPQALLFALCGILQCNLAVSTFCSGRDQIQLPAGSSKNFACPGTTNGQVRIRWETTNLNAEGFSDDEYFINVFDDADQVYRDGQHEDAAFGFSGTLGSAGGDNWVVQFACDLEVFFLNCEDGDFSFVLVDCGCPAGMEVDEECSISSLNSATDATCVPMATPNPTKAPVATPNPTRAPVTPSPTDGPGTDAPVTPSPTDVPAASPATPGGPGNCFSGETLVQVKNEVQPVLMKNLQVGDHILTKSNNYQPVYAFGHFDPATAAKFVQIQTTHDEEPPLELTENHMVYVEGKSAPVPAGILAVGDVLASTDSKGRRIESIKGVWREGLYAPLTPDGTLIVNNGIVASNYISLQPAESSEEFVTFKGLGPIPLSHAALAHAWLSPVRLYCMGVTSSKRSCNSYNEDGYLPYAALGLEFANLMDKQNLFVQVAMLSLVLLVIGVFLSIEVLFGAAHGPLLVFLIIPGIYRGYQMYGSRANKKGNAKKLV